MKRILSLLLILALLIPGSAALADPLALLEDYGAQFEEEYAGGTFTCSYRYPHVDDTAEGGAEINAFYEYLLNDTLDNYVPMIQDAYEGEDASIAVDYTVTCNNDDFFSVLVRTEKRNPDQDVVFWEAHVFSRKESLGDATFTLPRYLGLLETAESDTWLQDRQTGKADELIREMVWDMIEENEAGVAYSDSFDEEALARVFFPEEDFYLDENGDPVFFLQPGDVCDEVPEDAGLILFPIPLADILDEM